MSAGGKQPRRVWIELERPATKGPGPEREVQGSAIAELANNMLKRLGVTGGEFWWSEREARFCFGSGMGYTVLTENGEWFDLEYLGRPL